MLLSIMTGTLCLYTYSVTCVIKINDKIVLIDIDINNYFINTLNVWYQKSYY